MRHVSIGIAIIALVWSLPGCSGGSGSGGGSASGYSGAGTDDGSGSGGTGDFGDSCSVHYDCGAQLVCITGACQSAFPQTYVITFQSAQIANYKKSGENWDALGGAPDPVAFLYLDGKVECKSSVKQDTFDPVWNESCDVKVFKSSEIVFRLEDSDITDNDYIVNFSAGVPMADHIIKNQAFGSFTNVPQIKALAIQVKLK